MRLTIDKSELASAVSLAGNSVSVNDVGHRNFKYAKLSCQDHSFVVETSNGDLWTEIDLYLKEPQAPWRSMIPHAQLQGVISNLDDGAIDLMAEDDVLKLSQGGYNAQLQIRDATDFQSAPSAIPCQPYSGEADSPGRGIPQKPTWSPGRPLSVILKAVVSSVSTLPDRPYLTGVHLSVWGGKLTAVAANGGRIAIGTFPLGNSEESARKGALLPPALASHIAKMADMDEVNLWFASRYVRAEAPGVAITGLLIDAIFPPWRRAIPDEFIGSTVRVDRQRLIRALNRVNGVADKRSKTSLAVELSLRPGKLCLFAQRGGKDSAREAIDVELIDGLSPGDPYAHDETFPVELSYLIDAAKVTSGDLLDIQVSAIAEEKLSSGGFRNVPAVGLKNVIDCEESTPVIQHWIMARGRNK